MNNEMYYQVKDLRKFIICRREYLSSEMRNFLSNPKGYIQQNTIEYFKNGPGDTTTVAVVAFGDNKLVIKRYNPKGFWHSVKRMLRPSRALRSWENSHYLEQCDIRTPKPVGVLMERFGPIRQTTYFIMKYVDGLRGWDVFREDSKYKDSWKIILKNVAELLIKLKKARITHDDFHHNNMIFVDNIPILIDLDHMRIHLYNSIWFRHNYSKDVKNFFRVLGEINPGAQSMAENILTING
jgi:tRNA A-37 threonylcarbamoyl transferase component Bud32